MIKTPEQVSKDLGSLERLVRARLSLHNPFPASRSEPYEDGLQANKITPPQGLLAILGSLLFPIVPITLINGANQNVAIGNGVVFRITGPTANYSIGGFAGGVDGRIGIFFNFTVQQITYTAGDAGSTAANRITTFGANLVQNTGAGSIAMFVYDATVPGWLLLAHVP